MVERARTKGLLSRLTESEAERVRQEHPWMRPKDARRFARDILFQDNCFEPRKKFQRRADDEVI